MAPSLEEPNGSNGEIGELETRLFINGKFVHASDGKTFPLRSPVTHKVVAEIPEATVEDTNAAVAAAKAAQPGWAALSPAARGSYMKKLAALVRESHDELSRLEALSMGRPVQGYFEAFTSADRLESDAAAAQGLLGTSSLNTPGFVNMTFRQPYGVAAAIIPWNFPLVFFFWKISPAIATGNTVVLKSSEKAPLTSAKCAQLIEKAGFPPGVINVISGHGHISGSVLSHHMDVRVLSFTGSARTGRLLQEASAKSNLKNIILELGGKSPAVICDDADIEAAVEATKFSISFNSGQVCMANSRVYVQDTIAEKFTNLFKEKFGAMQGGDPLLKETQFGPVADEVQYNNVHRYIKEGTDAGAKMILGDGEKHNGDGYYIKPTIFSEAPEDAKIMKEEIFGPVLNISTFKSDEEVLKRANNSEFGLYAAVFTKNLDRAMFFAKGMEAGTVAVNCTSPTGAADMPFGGYKGSGVGREGLHESLDHFMETKSVLIKLSS